MLQKTSENATALTPMTTIPAVAIPSKFDSESVAPIHLNIGANMFDRIKLEIARDEMSRNWCWRLFYMVFDYRRMADD